MKVKFLPFQPHCFAFGGFEIQMLSTFESLKQKGVDVSKLDPWSRDADFDILHVWGLEHEHETTIKFAKNSGKKVVITALFPDYSSSRRKLRHFLSRYIGPVKYKINIASMVDKIVVVNDVEESIAKRYYDIPSSKLSYIPNIVDVKYFENKPMGFSFHSLNDYVLCTGNICPRKNQLNLAKACKQLGLKLILMGNPLLGEEAYCKDVEKIIQENPQTMMWISGTKENSDDLLSAYQHCGIFALPSLHEQGPISAYEAIATGCPVLLADRAYSYQNFYRNVERVNPESVASIVTGLQNITSNPGKYKNSSEIINACKIENVGESYKKLYESL